MSASGERRRKITLLGDAGVGKTALLLRHTTGRFEPRYAATESRGLVGCPVRRLTRAGRSVEYDVWDCAGQEKHDAARATSAAARAWVGTDAFLVVFDLTSRLSYEGARWWIERASASHPTVPIVLVGAKSESASRKLERVALHERHGVPYVEVSSKSNAIDAPFECLERLFFEVGP